MRLQKVIRLFGLLLLVAALAQVALAQNGHNGSLNGFDDYVQKALKEWEVPGVAIAIVKGDQIVLDMAQWVRLQLSQGAIKNDRIFTPAVAKEMHASQTIIRFEPPYSMWYPEAHFLNYGLGWFLSDYRGRKVVEHGGAQGGNISARHAGHGRLSIQTSR